MENKKLISGITLISLVVTIIILLILAGVAISSVVGDEGMIEKASTASEKTSIANDKTNIGLSVSEYQIEKHVDGNNEFEAFLESAEWCKEATYNENTQTATVTTNGNKDYTITDKNEIYSGKFDYVVYTKEELKQKVLDAEADSIIGIYGEFNLSGITLGDGTTKKLTLAGVEENGILNMDKAASSGVEFTIKDMTLKTTNTTYKGFTANKVNYENCKIASTYFCLAKNVVFKDCTFNISGDAYNIWTYSSDNMEFDNCTFNCDGKSVLIYIENSNGSTKNININKCKFISNNAIDGKASVEIDSSLGQAYTVNINNSSTKGFGKGSVSGEELWNEKKGDLADIFVDGEQVR